MSGTATLSEPTATSWISTARTTWRGVVFLAAAAAWFFITLLSFT